MASEIFLLISNAEIAEPCRLLKFLQICRSTILKDIIAIHYPKKRNVRLKYTLKNFAIGMLHWEEDFQEEFYSAFTLTM